jgi:Protein of unknown function DUF262/HNH endonuclease
MRQKNTKQMSINFIKFQMDQGKLNLAPDYQREAVWTTPQKQLLIDSLLNGIDIPKLYFHQRKQIPPEYDVVDGQQRIRAVTEFLAGEFRLAKDADPVDGHPCAGLYFSQLATDLQGHLIEANFDVVVMDWNYTDEDVREMFARLQNGTSLNAAEKRHAIRGGMNTVVQSLAKHPVFGCAGYTNKRFAYEDTAAKILHIMLVGNGDFTDIKPSSIARSYDRFSDLDDASPVVKRMRSAMTAVERMFEDGPSPELKKYAVVNLVLLLADLQSVYDVTPHLAALGAAYRSFEARRAENDERTEDERDVELVEYANAARADGIPDMRFRRDVLRKYLLLGAPEMAQRDEARAFKPEQRLAVHWRDKGVCQLCKSPCEGEAWEVDHVIPYSRGGKTLLSNAQLTCVPCNRSKGNSM